MNSEDLPAHVLVHEVNHLLVIIYTYIGYNVWDIPTDYPAILGNKYAYAVGRIILPPHTRSCLLADEID